MEYQWASRRVAWLCCRYLSFLKGIVDSDTLPLSVSRETLQAHSSLKVIKKKIVRKVLDALKKMSDAEKEGADAGTSLLTCTSHHMSQHVAAALATEACRVARLHALLWSGALLGAHDRKTGSKACSTLGPRLASSAEPLDT